MKTAFENDIRQCVAALQQCGVILYPTDTIWGLGCDAADEAAIEKISKLKHRPVQKSFVVLLADARQIFQFVAAPPPDIIELLAGFEEPTTVVYPDGLNLAPGVLAADGSVAIRVTKDAFCKALIKRFGGPVVSTSANISGELPPRFFQDINPEIIDGADYVVRFRQEEVAEKKASRILRLLPDGSFERLR